MLVGCEIALYQFRNQTDVVLDLGDERIRADEMLQLDRRVAQLCPALVTLVELLAVDDRVRGLQIVTQLRVLFNPANATAHKEHEDVDSNDVIVDWLVL